MGKTNTPVILKGVPPSGNQSVWFVMKKSFKMTQVRGMDVQMTDDNIKNVVAVYPQGSGGVLAKVWVGLSAPLQTFPRLKPNPSQIKEISCIPHLRLEVKRLFLYFLYNSMIV